MVVAEVCSSMKYPKRCQYKHAKQKKYHVRNWVSTPAENCTFMAGENCTPDDWVTNPKTPAPPGISYER